MNALQLPDIDAGLLPYLTAANRAAEDSALETLVQQAEPTIRRVIAKSGWLSASGAGPRVASRAAEQREDLYREAMLRLLQKLDELKTRLDGSRRIGAGSSPQHNSAAASPHSSIRSFLGLADSIARSLVYEHLRATHPNWVSLRGQIVYVIDRYEDPKTRQSRFARWSAEREHLCGFRDWLGRALRLTARYLKLKENPQAISREALRHEDARTTKLWQLLEALFQWLNTPVELDDMVNTVAQLRGVEDHPETSLDQPSGEGEDRGPIEPAGQEPLTEDVVLMKTYLRETWKQIQRLSSPQCTSLLLNLKDHRGKGVIDLLPGLRVATVREIAAAMQMPAERLAELWPSLPLEDQQIAQLLSCPTGRVAVYRWRARQKLEAALRGGEWEEDGPVS